jgi:DNA-directed RNA polymerase subunit RPC12/RpoP
MSNMRTSIKCNCGQRIIAKDVVQHGYYLRLFGPSFVYVKFRCSRCKKLGEQFIKQEEWEEGILKDSVVEIAPDEKAQFSSMGPIDIHEVIDFHFQLENLNDLKTLEAEIPVTTKKTRHRTTPQS